MKQIIIIIVLIFIGSWTYGWYQGKVAPSDMDVSVIIEGEEIGYFAGGCFWCVESDLEKEKGVKEAVSGYMGGDVNNPSYKEVSGGSTGHREVVKVVYDPDVVTYRTLVLNVLKHSDPTDESGSFYDRGHQYTSAVYYSNEDEKKIAEDVISELEGLGVYEKSIATSIEEADDFWIAEDYHQDYYKKSSVQYKYYRNSSGRDAFIESVWGSGDYDFLFQTKEIYKKPSDEELKGTLTPLQYKITQKEGTERPFDNEYWNNHEEGIYVDIVSGEPLFSSTDKFDSGTGWPSFLKPIDYSFVTERDDWKLVIKRTEIRSAIADSHLGHIILDGPIENDKIRYCMNSASLRFVPKENLPEEGLDEYLHLFE